ncbi:MAG: hypothetical protein IKQ18_07125, partial [Clostridia bacterium]|nr:hypothetical protein [Clostridia bacterium]
MSLLDLLPEESCWDKFYDYKLSLIGSKKFVKELDDYIKERRYLCVCDTIREGGAFPLPKKSVISKTGSDKKRTVYVYPKDETTALKMLTYLMLRKYDHLFSRGLYSFRPGRTAKDAVRMLLKKKELSQMYSYKADIHDYFN